MEKLLETQLLNQFQNDAVLSWNDLLQNMSSAHGRSRDEVFNGMNTLIDAGKIALPKDDVYCLPGTLVKLQQKEQDSKKMKRSDFDKLSYADRSAHINAGGSVIDG